MFILDTCFVSEFAKPIPHPGVVAWLEAQNEETLYVTTLTLGELVKGVERLPQGPKKTRLLSWLQADVVQRFAGRILAFDEPAAQCWGKLCAQCWGKLCAQLEDMGVRMPAVDAQIAAICLHTKAALVTRNEDDFANGGLLIVNPWS